MKKKKIYKKETVVVLSVLFKKYIKGLKKTTKKLVHLDRTEGKKCTTVCYENKLSGLNVKCIYLYKLKRGVLNMFAFFSMHFF